MGDFWAIDNSTNTGTAAHCLISIDPTSGSVRFYKYQSNITTTTNALMGNIAYWGGYRVRLYSAFERRWSAC